MTTSSVDQSPKRSAGSQRFMFVLAGLFLLRIVLDYLRLPIGFAFIASIVLALIFVGGPVLALFEAASERWSRVRAAFWLISGIAIQAISVMVAKYLLTAGIGNSIFGSLAQTGLIIASVGLGALIATLVTDRNLIAPIAVFLAGLDMFYIFTPQSLPKMILTNTPKVLATIGGRVPTVVPTEHGVTVGPGVLIGPADFVFMAMFFVAMFRFQMRTAATLKWLIPVLVAYLLLVLFGGNLHIGRLQIDMLPALLPIGATVLIVNVREFRMSPGEKWMTAFVGGISALLGGYGLYAAQNAPITPSIQTAEPSAPRGPQAPPSR